MLLLGAEAPGRIVEQHDYFFGIAENLKDLLPEIKSFWPEAGKILHVDGWREVTKVDHSSIRIVARNDETTTSVNKLFFVNLGGYTSGKLEEQHYIVLTAQDSRTAAMRAAKKSIFFTNSLQGIAASHIDEKQGVDVDSIHQIDELLSPELKAKYRVVIFEGANMIEDKIHLGYFKPDRLNDTF